MTWEELAAFIAALPEEERKRPAWRLEESAFIREIMDIKKAYAKDEWWMEEVYRAPNIKEGDWVIE